MDKGEFSKIEAFMVGCMSDSAHDKEHVYRVLANAMVIAQGEQAVDYDVLICSCLLHDIGRADQLKDPNLCHAQVGARKACAYLLNAGYDPAFADRVCDCIRTHRFRKNAPPESLEAKILFDADKLDVVGAIGVARTLVYKGTVCAPLYTRRSDGTISDGREDSRQSFFQEYCFKLEKLYDRFYTERGRELALERKQAAVNFYENLYREVSERDECGKKRLEQYLEG